MSFRKFVKLLRLKLFVARESASIMLICLGCEPVGGMLSIAKAGRQMQKVKLGRQRRGNVVVFTSWLFNPH